VETKAKPSILDTIKVKKGRCRTRQGGRAPAARLPVAAARPPERDQVKVGSTFPREML
jgi:hypothetical protein